MAFYLRSRPGTDGTIHHRLFHQALNDHLRRHPFQPAGSGTAVGGRAVARAVFRGLLRSIRPSRAAAPRWETAEPYLLRAAVSHAIDAGQVDDLLTDLEFLVHADPATLIPALDAAGRPDSRRLAAVYRTSAARHVRARPATRRQLLSLDATRFDLMLEAARLSRPDDVPLTAWSPVWSTSAQVDPALMTTLDVGGWIRAIALTRLWGRSIAVIADAHRSPRLACSVS